MSNTTHIELSELEKGHVKIGEGVMFVDYKRYDKPFIRAIKIDDSKSFDFSDSGLKQAIKYLGVINIE